MKRTALVLAILVLGAAVSAREPEKASAAADPAKHRGEPWCGERMLKDLADDSAVQKRLRLSEDQVVRLRAIRDETHLALEPLQERSRKARAAFCAALKDDEAPRGEISDLYDASLKACDAIGQELLEHLLDVRDLLAKEQHDLLRALYRERNGNAPEAVAGPLADLGHPEN